MKKTIHLTQTGFSNNVSKWFFLLMGVSNCFQGVERLQRTNSNVGFAIFMIVTGVFMMFPAFILFFPSSALAPKCTIDEDMLSIKEDIHKKWKKVKWNDVKQLTFKSFVIEFVLHNQREEFFHLRTNGETSIEIKKAIREMADRKSIPVVGG